ncbi:atpE [Acrasis kona]|uniref:AtpE n=1 Tax=Acrasis kona TaxID=1008807 RepID=A0AAW2Z8Q5_9EUKA
MDVQSLGVVSKTTLATSGVRKAEQILLKSFEKEIAGLMRSTKESINVVAKSNTVVFCVPSHSVEPMKRKLEDEDYEVGNIRKKKKQDIDDTNGIIIPEDKVDGSVNSEQKTDNTIEAKLEKTEGNWLTSVRNKKQPHRRYLKKK